MNTQKRLIKAEELREERLNSERISAEIKKHNYRKSYRCCFKSRAELEAKIQKLDKDGFF